ncbi:MAG: hypothetical protein AAF236_05570 [Verrucomicrobiota bacterium]
MGRIVAQVRVENAVIEGAGMDVSALVDTGAAMLTLPAAWKDRFGAFKRVTEEAFENASGDTVIGEVAGPVEIVIERFRPIYSDVLFIEMRPDEKGYFEPLLGYIPLESANLGVDMVGHRLISAKRMDLK